MTAQHKATPQQWAELERYLDVLANPIVASVIIELRDRIEALEAAASCRSILGTPPPRLVGW